MSKLSERAVILQLIEHVTNNNILERNQSAYRQYHSTETAHLHITNCLLESTDQGRVSILTLLDLSAAFDTLDHSILLGRLNVTFGISGSALQWVRCYIINRSETFVVNGMQFTPRRLDFGVPQGSVLGPILFVLYTQPVARFTHRPTKKNPTLTSFQTIHSFSMLPLLLSLVFLLNRQSSVSSMSKFGWIPTNSNSTTTKPRQ